MFFEMLDQQSDFNGLVREEDRELLNACFELIYILGRKKNKDWMSKDQDKQTFAESAEKQIAVIDHYVKKMIDQGSFDQSTIAREIHFLRMQELNHEL